MPSTKQTIDELLHFASLHKDAPDANYLVDKYWSQGRTVYGGLSAAMLYMASKSHIHSLRVLRSISTNFVGPLLVDVPFTIQVEVIREGKNVSQVQARAIQEDKVAVVAQCCFGENRASKISVKNAELHDLPTPTNAKFIPQIPKVTPKYFRHIDLSINDGGIPFTGKSSTSYGGWMRYTTAPESITDGHIIGLIDAWPPTVIQMLKWPAPASTINWNLEFIHPHRDVKPKDWFAYKSHTRHADAGYAHSEATIWDSHGKVIALSRQTIAVFD